MEQPAGPSREEILHLASLGEVYGGFAHDIAQPLNAIGIACQLIQLKLERSQMPETEKAFLIQRLEIVSSQVQRASDILANFSSFYRRDRTQAALLDIGSVFNKIYDLMEQQLTIRGIAVTWNCQEGLSPLEGNLATVENIVVQSLAFSRDTVGMIGNWHEKQGLAYERCLRIDVTEATDRQSMRVEWDLGLLPRGTQLLAPSSHAGLAISGSVLRDMAGSLTARDGELTISFPLRA